MIPHVTACCVDVCFYFSNKQVTLTDFEDLGCFKESKFRLVWYKYYVGEKVKEKHCKSPCCFMSLCHVVFHQCSAFPSSGFWQTRLSDSSNWGVPHPGSSGFTWNVFPLLHKTSIELGEPAPPFTPPAPSAPAILALPLPFQLPSLSSSFKEWRWPPLTSDVIHVVELHHHEADLPDSRDARPRKTFQY